MFWRPRGTLLEQAGHSLNPFSRHSLQLQLSLWVYNLFQTSNELLQDSPRVGNKIACSLVPLNYHFISAPVRSLESFFTWKAVLCSWAYFGGRRWRVGSGWHRTGWDILAIDLEFFFHGRSLYSPAATPRCYRDSASCPSSISVTLG